MADHAEGVLWAERWCVLSDSQTPKSTFAPRKNQSRVGDTIFAGTSGFSTATVAKGRRTTQMNVPRFHIRTAMLIIALAAIALAAWLLVPPWWQYHQSIKTLTG
jgi:uncharacterized membrane protein